MDTQTRQRVTEYIGSLVGCEEAVAEFYRACAAAWPQEAVFWDHLADEETAHAVRLELVQARVRETPHGVGLARPYSEISIRAFIGTVRDAARQVRAGAMRRETALVRARDLEQSLIESQPLRGLSFDDPRFGRYWEAVSGLIVRHSRRVLEHVGAEVELGAQVA